jgi:hypothetical protein
MTTDTQTKKRTVTLTAGPPVKITEADWPVIAIGSRVDWDGEHQFQSFREWIDAICVRRHADGRAIVYGMSHHSTVWDDDVYLLKAGRRVNAGENIVAAIYTVVRDLVELGAPDEALRRVAAECIANLPVEEL